MVKKLKLNILEKDNLGVVTFQIYSKNHLGSINDILPLIEEALQDIFQTCTKENKFVKIYKEIWFPKT